MQRGLTAFAIALSARIICIIWSGSGWYVLDPMVQDGLVITYYNQGYDLAWGKGYLINGMPEMLHPPGLPILVAIFHTLTGGTAQLPLQLLGAFLDSLTAALLTWLVSGLLAPRAGMVAGLLYALWPSAVWGSAGALTPEGIMAFFILGAFLSTMQSARSHGWFSWTWATVAGVAVGLASYLRPDYLLLPVGLAPGLWLWTRRMTRTIVITVLVQGLAFLVLLPWAWRNHEICGRWVFTSSSTGGTLISGLGEFHNVWGFGYSDGDRAREAATQGFSSPWSPEADEFFRGVFLKAITDHPGDFLLSVLHRVPLAIVLPQSFGFANPEKTQTFAEVRLEGKDRFQILRERPLKVLGAYWDYLLVGGLNFLGFVACGIMLLAERGRRGLVFLLLSPHLYGIGAHLLTHLEPRYLLPTIFVFPIGLGWLVNYAISRNRQQRGDQYAVEEAVRPCLT